MPSHKHIEHAAATLSFGAFWTWLQAHPNCILRAGTPEVVLYVVAYLDRINVGFAALQMRRDLGFADTVYGLGAGIFFVGYFLFEVPSNLLLERLGARLWIARI